MASEVCSSSSAADSSEKQEILKKANELLAQGKRNVVCGEVPKAISLFDEAVQLLAKEYGDLSRNCADAYFSYGSALLELGRMETNVLGVALEGVDVEAKEDEAESDQFEKPPEENGEERAKLRSEVYDAMAEGEREELMKAALDNKESDSNKGTEDKEPKEGEKETSEARESLKEKDANVKEPKTESVHEAGDASKVPENKMDTKTEQPKKESLTEVPPNKGNNGDDDDDDDNGRADKVQTKESDSKKPGEEPEESGNKADDDNKEEGNKLKDSPKKINGDINELESRKENATTDKEKDPPSEKNENPKDAQKNENPKDTEKKENPKDTEKESKGNSDVEMADADNDKGEEEDAENEEDEAGDEAAEGEEAGDEAAEGEEENQEGAESQDDGEEKDEDVPNFQLAWEYLDLAKVIYSKSEIKEEQLKAAECHIKLGEVSMETEQHETAAEDLQCALKIQQKFLSPEDRVIAETHYQLGLAYGLGKEFELSIQHYQQAISVIEAKIASLSKLVEESEVDADNKENREKDDLQKYKDEIKELQELIPEMKNKIEDTRTEAKDMEKMKEMAKEMLGLSGTSKGFGSPTKKAEMGASSGDVDENGEKKASDISSLVRKKRKPEEEESSAGAVEVKKIKQDEGAAALPNGDADVKEASEVKVNGAVDVVKVNGTAEGEVHQDAAAKTEMETDAGAAVTASS